MHSTAGTVVAAAEVVAAAAAYSKMTVRDGPSTTSPIAFCSACTYARKSLRQRCSKHAHRKFDNADLTDCLALA